MHLDKRGFNCPLPGKLPISNPLAKGQSDGIVTQVRPASLALYLISSLFLISSAVGVWQVTIITVVASVLSKPDRVHITQANA